MKISNKQIYDALNLNSDEFFTIELSQLFNKLICVIRYNTFLYDNQKEIIKKHCVSKFKQEKINIHCYRFNYEKK